MIKKIGLLYRHSYQVDEALAECAIKTKEGAKVADVAWASEEIVKIIQTEIECSIAVEICIKVMSMCNTQSDMVETKRCFLNVAHKKFGNVIITAILNFILCKSSLVNQKFCQIFLIKFKALCGIEWVNISEPFVFAQDQESLPSFSVRPE
ncbi:MAG: hypothetical protein WAW61_05540 [Methylococcaceae bacterium]